MSEVRATVAICTRNRAAVLARALGGLTALELPAAASWEVLVVDNDSSDGTMDVLAQFADELPLRVAREETPGVSAARNRAVSEAHGEYLLWIDDDAVPHRRWLAAYLEAFDKWPDAALLGGPIDLEFDAELPDWFRRVLPRVGPVFGERDLGEEPLLLPPKENMLPFGTNYVTRTEDQRRFAYDGTLGRHPLFPGRGCEETDLMLAMLASGLIGRWVPGARVTHLKGLDRVNTAFLATHWEEYGAYRGVRRPPSGRRVAGAPIALWWRVARAIISYAVSKRVAQPEQWIEDLAERSEALGILRGVRSLSS